MIKTFVFALAVAALGMGAYTAKTTGSHSGKATLIAAGGSNCPVYYGCPTPPPPAPKGGGSGGGGGVDNTKPHA